MSRQMERMLLIVLISVLVLSPIINAFALDTEFQDAGFILSDDEDLEEAEPSASASNLSKPSASASNLSQPQTGESSRIQTATSSEFQIDVVWNETELEEWINRHTDTSGTVYLGTSVTITQDISCNIHSDITVNTGEHSLIYDGYTLPTEIFITGEGLDSPVLDVYRTNTGEYYYDSWNNTLIKLNVTATGRDGKGGTALRILAKDAKMFSIDTLETQGIIRSYGEGAIGLWLDVPMEAWCYQVEVSGENSMAVYAPGGADLYYCKLTAEGNGASAAVGSNVLLDTCAASPDPVGVINHPRSLVPESLEGLYLPVKQNDYVKDALFGKIFFSLSGGEGYIPVRQAFPIAWDTAAINSIDTSVLGEHYINGNLYPAFQGVGLDTTFLLTVEVRDPGLPCIAEISATSDESGKYFTLSRWDSNDPADGKIILERSDDAGKTWFDATWAEDIHWMESDIYFFFDRLEHPVWFKLTLADVGNSNIVVLSQNTGLANGGRHNGDRTGTDRGDALSLSEDDYTLPDEGGGNSDDGNSGGGNSNGGSGSGGSSSSGSGSSSDNNTTVNGGGETPSQENTSGNDIQDPGGEGTSYDDRTAGDNHTEINQENRTSSESSICGRIKCVIPVTDTQSTGQLSEVIDRSMLTQETEKMNPDSASDVDTPLPYDPKQTAPEPAFPVKTFTIFFAIAAALSCCALLILKLCSKQHK